MQQRALLAIAAIIGCAATPLGIYLQLPESRGLAVARSAYAYVRELQPELVKDTRFRAVRLSVFTQIRILIKVEGDIASEDDLAALRDTLERAHPPIELWWNLKIAVTGNSVRHVDRPPAASP